MEKQPVLFIGHGHPINAIEKNDFTDFLTAFGKKLTKPKAILVVSAHWETEGTYVSTNPKPQTIYDFGNFHPDLFKIIYPASGSPEFAQLVLNILSKDNVKADNEMGLDHGAWTILKYLFPKADVPVFQMSLDFTRTPQSHFEIASKINSLREKGLMIVCSGNIVHNLRMVDWHNRDAEIFDWVREFDSIVKDFIIHNSFEPLINFKSLGEPARLSIPTSEHYLPMLYALALKQPEDKLKFIYEGFQYAAISMRSLIIE